jgi:hypothetical protein
MTSEWLKVMLDEIARKQAEAVQAREEEERRSEERRSEERRSEERRSEEPRSEERRAEEHEAGRSAPSVVVQSGEFDPRKKNGDAA